MKNNLIADKVIFSMKFSMMDEFFDVIGVHNTGNKRKTRIKKRKSPKTSESDCKDNVLRDENSCKSDDSGDLSDHFQRYFDKNECINPKSESEREPVVSVKMEIDNFVCVESFMIKEEPQFLYSSEDDMPLLSLNKKNKNSTPPSQYNIDGDFQADKNVPINDLNDCSNFSNSSSVDFGPVSLNCDDNFLKSEPSLEDNVSKVEIKSKMTIEECLSRKKAEQFCDVCGKFFKQVNSFKLHMEDHEKGLSHKCDFCKQIFSTSIAKVKHMTKKHNYEACEMDAVKRLSYNCDDCNKIFKYEDLLIMHNMKHHREKCDEKTINSFTCPFCAKVCVKRFQLKRHVQEVHASKSFTCEICAKQFSRESILQAHMKTVHRVLKDRPTCEICGACFVTKYQLESHVVQQHSVKQETLMIGINDETKNPNNTKIQHVVAKNKNSTFKSNESKYICKYCGEDVGSDWKRRGHYEYIHDDGKKPMRSCKMCQLDFDSFTNFKAHIIAHNDPLICKICGEWCYTEVQLTNHTKGHTRIEKDQRKYECDICGVRSARKQHLVIHMRNHTGSCPFMCETCGRGFKFDSCYNYHKLKCAGRNIEKRFVSCEIYFFDNMNNIFTSFSFTDLSIMWKIILFPSWIKGT